ncbi:hypothetical protein HK098_008326 [Nowakowskiella sp. JEL0407]|nr:hypothetical protein HK098_008326 [Nowakowskiella sp. JEL0407]
MSTNTSDESLFTPLLRFISDSPIFANLALVFIINQVCSMLKLDDVQNSLYIFIAFGLVQIAMFAVLGYIYLLIEKVNDQTVLTYTDLKIPGDSSSAEVVKKTVAEHDHGNLITALGTQAFSLGLMIFLNYKFGYLRPLLMQCVLGPRQFIQTQLVKVYILKEPATGALARPWRQSSPLTTTPLPSAKELKNKEKREQKKKLK